MPIALIALFGTPPWFFDLVAAVVGACIGSFLNVVIVRLPAGRSIVRPGSHCACGEPLRWYENIPLFSWLALRGKARCCGRRISARYPVVEALTALAFLACWHRLAPGPAVCGWVFCSALIAASFIDLDHLMIPEVLTTGLGLTGLALSFAVPALHGQASGLYLLDAIRSEGAAVEGLLIGSGLVLWIAVVAEAVLKKEAMGMGDVIFAGAIGTFCGWHGALFAVFGGAAVGAVGLPIALLGGTIFGRPRLAPPAAAEGGGEGLHRQVPFGPMLAVAAGLYLLFLHPVVDAWFHQVGTLF
jgi:leader peptidase (prepilin peptidase)/N-methyltransferase